MKISESNIQISAFHTAEQADLFKQEQFRERMGRALGRSGGNDRAGEKIPGIWVDRVNISRQASRQIQSEYRGRMESRSRVAFPENGPTRTFQNQELVERLVGEIMDRDVAVRTLKDGDDRAGEGSEKVAAPGPSRRGGTRVSLRSTRIHFEQEQMGVSSRGQVRTRDGRAIDFTLDLAMDRAFLSRTQEETLIHTWKEKVSLVDPLVISLDNSTPELTDTRFEFDLNNDGVKEEISFVSRGAGFLSLDLNNDGKINNGSELFGPGTGNGFGELGGHDLDKNGWIDENDAVFSRLRVWTRDEQGSDVLVSLKEAGVGAIFLDNVQSRFDMTTMDNEPCRCIKKSRN